LFFDIGVLCEADGASHQRWKRRQFFVQQPTPVVSATGALGHLGFFFARVIPVGIEAVIISTIEAAIRQL